MSRVRAGAAGLLLSCVVAGASGAEFCARAPELTALQVAAVQQELMVAAFACNDVTLYNRFVVAYRNELQSSDDTLQAFFARREDGSGASEYHAYKTKMANVYSVRSNADKKGYCLAAQRTFTAALSGQRKNLASFALSQPVALSEPYTRCGAKISGGSMVTGAKANVANAGDAPAAAPQTPAPAVTVAAVPNRPPIEKVLPVPPQAAPSASEAPAADRPPIEKVTPLSAAEPQYAEKESAPAAPTAPEPPPVSEKPAPMIAATPPEPPPANATPEPSPPSPPATTNPVLPPQQAAPPPPVTNGNNYAQRTPPPRQDPYGFAPRRYPPPPYRFVPRYYAGGPNGQGPYRNPYYIDPYPRSPLYYYRAPDPPGSYRDYRFHDYPVPGPAPNRAPYGYDERSGNYDSDDDRSFNRAPNDPRFYERDRYGTVPPQRY